jgi:ankyrin repeat protein
VNLLLEDYKSDVAVKDNENGTVLHWAADGGHKAVVRLLLEDYKANVDAKDNKDITALKSGCRR